MTPSRILTARHHPESNNEFVAATSTQDDFVPAPEDVARLAYMYFENHGEANGRDLEDWHQAEAELKAERQLVGS
jgi:hypothetical protein